jgi:SP family arabinose:H+ symporter-like MFS transporter
MHTYNRSFIIRISLVAALGGLLFGFDTAVISGAIPFITPYFGLSDLSLGWAVGAVLIGCLLGAAGAGPAAEARGRRYVLKWCAALFAVSGLGAALSTGLGAFILFRMIGGLGVGGAAMVSPMYIAEMAPAYWRGRLVSLYQLAIVTGILLAYYTNYLMAGFGEHNWRWMFAAQVLPSLLFGALLLLVPETPRWLVKKGKEEEAARILEKTGGPAFRRQEMQEIENSFHRRETASLSGIFLPKYRSVVLLGMVVAVFQQVTGINAILYYAPVIFRETGVDNAGSLLQTTAIGAVNVLSACVAIGLVDRLGRRRLLTSGSLLMGLSLVVVAFCFRQQYFGNYIVLIFTLVYVAAFGATLGAVTWVYLSEVFPNSIRGLALSAATLALWAADFLVTWTFPVMAGRLGTAATLLCYAGCCALAFLYFVFRLPETKGKTLEEIERSLFTH